jgi:hypothetical protein
MCGQQPSSSCAIVSLARLEANGAPIVSPAGGAAARVLSQRAKSRRPSIVAGRHSAERFAPGGFSFSPAQEPLWCLSAEAEELNIFGCR